MVRILYVEDNSFWAYNVKLCLWSLGHCVTHFSFLSDAKIVFSCGPSDFDIIICDVTLQRHEDGLEWAEELNYAGYNVIIVSGYCDSPNIPFVRKGPLTHSFLKFYIERMLTINY